MYRRIWPGLRWLAVLITLALLAAFHLLYFRPDDTGSEFVWRLAPHMTSYLVGAGYFGGAYLFARIAYSRLWWHEIRVGIAAVIAFCFTMAGLTVIHWNEVNNNVADVLWIILYFPLPVALVLLLAYHERRAPEQVERAEPYVPYRLRLAYFIVGAALFVAGSALYLFPNQLGPFWPWPLTQRSALTMGGWLMLPGVVGLLLPLDPRWSAWKIVLTVQATSLVFILIGVAFAWQDFSQTTLTTPLFVGGLGAILLLVIYIFWEMETGVSKAMRQDRVGA